MATSLLSSLTSRVALLSNIYFAKWLGGVCSMNYIRSSRPSFKFRYISLRPQSRPQRLYFCSTTVARGGSNRSPAREDLVVLGIETSCDDTAAAVVRGNGEILGQIVSSQADLLSRYGGVAPKMAEEAHSLVIDQVVQQALDASKLTGEGLSAVAVTIGPGLSLCLRVGVTKARRVAGRFNLPIIGVHHMEAHALVSRLVDRDLQFPFLALLISGDASAISRWRRWWTHSLTFRSYLPYNNSFLNLKSPLVCYRCSALCPSHPYCSAQH